MAILITETFPVSHMYQSILESLLSSYQILQLQPYATKVARLEYYLNLTVIYLRRKPTIMLSRNQLCYFIPIRVSY